MQVLRWGESLLAAVPSPLTPVAGWGFGGGEPSELVALPLSSFSPIGESQVGTKTALLRS